MFHIQPILLFHQPRRPGFREYVLHAHPQHRRVAGYVADGLCKQAAQSADHRVVLNGHNALHGSGGLPDQIAVHRFNREQIDQFSFFSFFAAGRKALKGQLRGGSLVDQREIVAVVLHDHRFPHLHRFFRRQIGHGIPHAADVYRALVAEPA